METAPTDCDFQLPPGKPLTSVGAQLWPQSPLEEGCGLAPQVGCAVCSVSLLPSLSLAPRGLMVVAGVACEAAPWPWCSMALSPCALEVTMGLCSQEATTAAGRGRGCPALVLGRCTPEQSL